MVVYDHRNGETMYAYSYVEEPSKREYDVPVQDGCGTLMRVEEFAALVESKNAKGFAFPVLNGHYAKGSNIGIGYQYQLDNNCSGVPKLATHVIIFEAMD